MGTNSTQEFGEDAERSVDASWTAARKLPSEPPASSIRRAGDEMLPPSRRSAHVAVAAEPGIATPVLASILRTMEDRYGAAALEGDDTVAAVKAHPGPIVPGSVADTLLDALGRRTNDEAIGVTLGRLLPVGGLGLLDYALCSSAILRDALQRLSRYHGILTQRVKVVLEEDGELATLTYVRDSSNVIGPRPTEAPRPWVEFGMAAALTRIRYLVGETFVLESASFAHDAPSDVEAHAAFFGAPVVFGQAHDRLTFARAFLDRKTRTGAPALATLLDEKMVELEPSLAMDDVFLDRAHRTILELLDTRECRLESVADRLQLSRRTLQRELQRRGTSHTAILDRARRERAIRLLSETRVTVNEVAERLGFSEPGAFFRAFRRWTGTSPKAFHDSVVGARR